MNGPHAANMNTDCSISDAAIPGLRPSFSEWHCEIMLPGGQLAERLNVAEVRSYGDQGTGVSVGGASPPAGGSGGLLQGKFYL